MTLLPRWAALSAALLLLFSPTTPAQGTPLADGSFELQGTGSEPGAPWSVTFGTTHRILPMGVAEDSGMPSDGRHWAELGAAGTNAATPPSNPGGAGTAPVGAAGISQSFSYSASPHFFFTAAFVLGGPPSSAVANDFMSVDVTDGVTTHNLYYADTYSNFTSLSLRHVAPMTDVEAVFADLSTLFPGSDTSTVFTITAQVGNGGDGQDASHGYVDRFGFVPFASIAARNGSNVNSACLLSTGPPVMGAPWTARVDHGQHPGATLTILLGRSQPTMGGITPYGEVLVTGFRYYKGVLPSAGTFDDHGFDVPVDLVLAGLPAHVQAIIVGGAGPELCNALDCTIGF